MPGSKTPKPPASQIHCWPGCQCRTSSFQVTRSRLIVQPARAFFGLVDGLVVLGMPGREDDLADLRGERLQILELAQGRGGRLFQEHALAGEQRLAGDLVADLRRRADRHRVEVREASAARGSPGRCTSRPHGESPRWLDTARSSKSGIGLDDRQMLILRDLAEADDADAVQGHGRASSILDARAKAVRRRASRPSVPGNRSPSHRVPPNRPGSRQASRGAPPRSRA